MGSICLSSPTVLRCQSFTIVQSGVLLVPAGLEALIACWTVYANWGLGHRKQLLLGAEGCTYLMLALLDLLSHLLPAIRDDIRTFKVVDTVLGVASVFPIFFYGLFVFFLLRSQFIGCFPRWLKLSIQIIMLVVFLPVTLVMYEVASFVGITHGTFSNGASTVVAVGFQDKEDQALWKASTYADLAVLAAFQALPAILAVRRLIHVSRQHKEIQSSANGTVHSFGGTIWTTTGLVIGLVETLVGYAPPTFAASLARRILRAISRAKLCVGISLGMESVETFDDARPDRRRSRLMQMIANPRLSTFRALSPTAVAFHAAPRAPEKPISAPVASLGLPGMRAFANMRSDSPVERKGERVTVYYGGQRAPTLHLRFSELNMPSPSVITEKFRVESPRPSEMDRSWRASSSWSMVTGRPSENMASKSNISSGPGMHAHSKSLASMPDSFRAVQELTPQFPHLPDMNNWKMPIYAHRPNLSKASISRRTVSVGSSISYPSAVGARLPSETDSAEVDAATGMRPVTMYYYTGRHRRDTTGDTTRTPRAYHGRGDTISEADPAPATPNSDDRSSLQPWGTHMPRTSSPESWRETAGLGNDSWASRRWVPSGVIEERSRWASWQPDAQSKPPSSKKDTTPTPPIRQETAEAISIPWLRDLDEGEREREERRMYLAPAPSVHSLTNEGSGALKLSRGPTPRTPTPTRPLRGPLNSEYVERWSRAPTDVTDEGIVLSASYDSHVLGRMNVV